MENKRLQNGERHSFLDSVVDTTGMKGVVLVSYLVLVTLVSAAVGTRALEGVVPGAVLLAALLAALYVEKQQYGGKIDSVGLLVIGIVAVYTVMEAAGVRQHAWFPLASAAALFGMVAWTAVQRQHSDVVDFMGNVDLVGLYGSVLLVIYSILLLGGQLDFIYTPYFPGFALVFVGSVLMTSVAYVSKSGLPEATRPGELHHRLISVVRSLDGIENEGEREELAQQVRAVAGVLNGVTMPSRVEDSQGHVPIVLPVSNFVMAFGSAGFDNLLDRVREDGVTGYVTDSDENVVLLRNGVPVKYYVRGRNELGTDVSEVKRLDPEAFESGVRVFEATYTLVDAIESVTPVGVIVGEEVYREEAREPSAREQEEAARETIEEVEERTEPSTEQREPAQETTEEAEPEEQIEETIEESDGETEEDVVEPEGTEEAVEADAAEADEAGEEPGEEGVEEMEVEEDYEEESIEEELFDEPEIEDVEPEEPEPGEPEDEGGEEIEDISIEAETEEEPLDGEEVEDISMDADEIGAGVDFDVGDSSDDVEEPADTVEPPEPSPEPEEPDTDAEQPESETGAGTQESSVDTSPEVDREVSKVEREMADAIDDLPDKIRVGENEIDLGKMFGERTKTRGGAETSVLPDTIRVGDNEIDVKKMFERTDDMFD